GEDTWALGADTIVACEGELLGKPADEDDARRMLHLQAGRRADVITGVALVGQGEYPERIIRHASTAVWMRYDLREIDDYIAGGDWRGKAGAYGIQNIGDRLVERIEGSFTNVVGLPLELVAQLLRAVRLLPLPSDSRTGIQTNS
ncbi:MAG: Maf family protein, partial [Phycisphaerae bacterium]|nr:Maf family protein [Phycisphaerae bacterium]